MRFMPRRLGYGEEATLVEHLGELRTRLAISLLALAVAFGVTFAFHSKLIHWLNLALPPDRRNPITLGVAEPFLTSIMVSLYAGFLVALPIILWQVWSFFAPAIREHTQRTVAGFVLMAAVLLAAGVAFGYWIALPAAVHFLTNYDSDLFNIQIRAKDYYSFAALVLLAMAVVFELPIFILGLVRLRIVTAKKLRTLLADRDRRGHRARGRAAGGRSGDDADRARPASRPVLPDGRVRRSVRTALAAGGRPARGLGGRNRLARAHKRRSRKRRPRGRATGRRRARRRRARAGG